METIIKKGAYTAPLDSSVFEPIEYALHKRTVKAGDTTLLPLELISPITKEERFYPTTFRVLFDSSCLSYNGFVNNGLLAGVPITVTPIHNGVEISIDGKYTLDMPGILGALSFIASNPYDTTTCVVRLESWIAEAGCFVPVLHNGQITILPDLPVITGSVILPEALVCTGDSNIYNPNPFTVRFYVYNNGEIEAINTKLELITDPSALELVSPSASIQVANPPAVLVNDSSYAEWQLRALPRNTGDSIEISALVTSSNHPPVLIATNIWIPPTCAELACSIDAAQQEGSAVIDATVHVTNLGGETTDTAYASIVLPAPLALYGADAPDKYTKSLVPENILHNASSTATWQIDCSLAENRDYTIGVWTWSANADSAYCETIVSVELPVASCTISAPTALARDAHLYTPNPFYLKYTLLNTGNAELGVTEITIQLPAQITTTDALTRSVAPLVASGQHDITWSLKALTSAYDREAVITVVAKDAEGNILSSCEHRVFIPGVDGLSCDAGENVTLVYNIDESRYEPGVFSKQVTVHNSLDTALTNVEIEASVSSTEVAITSPNPAMNAVSVIPANNSWITDWDFNVIGSDVATTVTVTYRSRSDQYPDWRECSFDVIVPPREYTYCADCLADGIDTVWIDRSNEIMYPVPFQVYTAVTNNCTGILTDIQCTITMPSRLSLAPGESASQMIDLLKPGETMYVLWMLTAAIGSQDDALPVQIRINNGALPPIVCEHTVYIQHSNNIQLAAAKKLLYFRAVQNDALPAAQEIVVYAGFPIEMPWTAQYPAWLDIAPDASPTFELVAVQPNTTALPIQRHYGSIAYSSAHPNAPKNVEVVYDIVATVGVPPMTSTPTGIVLHQNYPNPFASSTTISYTTDISQSISITVYNTLGVSVKEMRQEAVSGNNTIQISGLRPGLYMVVVRGNNGIASGIMLGR